MKLIYDQLQRAPTPDHRRDYWIPTNLQAAQPELATKQARTVAAIETDALRPR